MLRWMCVVTLRDRKQNEEFMDCLRVVSLDEVVTRKRLRWYGHVERKDKSDRELQASRKLQNEGTKTKVRGMVRGRETTV